MPIREEEVKCEAMRSCKREAMYWVRVRGNPSPLFACRVHACHYEDSELLEAAVKLDTKEKIGG